MSQSANQVEWCLKKAKKEIEECKKLKKRPKHRGLFEVNPDIERAKEHLKKAEENLLFAISLDAKKYGYKIIETLFYSVYQCFLSIAIKFGYESGNQTCTIALIEFLKEQNKIDLDKKFIEMMKYKEDQADKTYLSIIEMREDYTYSAKISVEENKIANLIKECQEVIEQTKQIIYQN